MACPTVVVEVMGSTCLKSSDEWVLSDLLHGGPCMNSEAGIITSENFDDACASDEPMSLDAGHKADACDDIAGIMHGDQERLLWLCRILRPLKILF